MKLPHSLYFLLLLGALSSCQHRNCCDEVVCETVHRYGVPLAPEDWSARGQCGQIISMRKDGVAVNRNYDNGILHGECSYTFAHRDTVQKREMYEQGNLKQEQIHYTSGMPYKQTIYEGPNSQSTTVWYESGAPHARELANNNGYLLQAEYYNIDQQLESHVQDGNGLRTRRNGQGELQSIDTIENGHMILSTTYHPNGTPATTTPYINNAIEGERRTYSPGGEPKTIEIWTNNVQQGMTQEFEHGEKRADVPYINGQKHGIERRYRDDGQTVAQEINWVQGQKHGPTHSYIGNTKTTDWYFRNRQVANKATFDMMSNQ